MPVEGEDAAELAGDDREALNELWRQVMGELAARVRMGAEQVRFELAPEGETPAAGPAAKMEFDGGGRRIRLQVVLSGGLEQGIAPPAAEAEEANAAEAAEATPAPPLTGEVTGQSRVSAAFPNLRPENLELLLDVELPATLRFGQKQMRLSEILQLSAGAVIDLDREVQEPVELLVDGKLIARGEAVIVDGNYGLRVTELATPRERLEAIP
jgi:flagellar motor switch protein FliN/FliY